MNAALMEYILITVTGSRIKCQLNGLASLHQCHLIQLKFLWEYLQIKGILPLFSNDNTPLWHKRNTHPVDQIYDQRVTEVVLWTLSLAVQPAESSAGVLPLLLSRLGLQWYIRQLIWKCNIYITGLPSWEFWGNVIPDNNS